jgi:hypothetical protein
MPMGDAWSGPLMICFAADTAAAKLDWRRICFWKMVRGMLSARSRHCGHMNDPADGEVEEVSSCPSTV